MVQVFFKRKFAECIVSGEVKAELGVHNDVLMTPYECYIYIVRSTELVCAVVLLTQEAFSCSN